MEKKSDVLLYLLTVFTGAVLLAVLTTSESISYEIGVGSDEMKPELYATVSPAPIQAQVAVAEKPASSPAPRTRVVMRSKTHRIRRGDTLSRIARRYGISVADVVDANRISDPNRIITGRTLVIPSISRIIN